MSEYNSFFFRIAGQRGEPGDNARAPADPLSYGRLRGMLTSSMKTFRV